MPARVLKNDRGVVLIASLLIALFLAILLGAAMARMQSNLKEVNHRIALQRAFYAAESGIDRAIAALRQNAQWQPGQNGEPAMTDVPLTEAGKMIGFYTITVAPGERVNGWDTVWIRSLGQDDFQQVRRVVVAQVLVESPSRFLVSTLGDLRVGSGAGVEADVLAKDIYFEVNETLSSPEKDIVMAGDIFYINGIHGQGNPAVRMTGETYASPSITFPGVDVAHYQELATSLSASGEAVAADGDLTVELDNLAPLAQSGADAFHPKLIFATGNVTVVGTYSQSLLIVAGKNIYIQGDIKPDTALDLRPQLGLFASQDVVIPSDVTTTSGDLAVEAFLIADGNGATVEGSFRAEGDKFSLGRLDFDGAISVRGKGRTGIDLNTFNQRNYTFNAELNQRRDIPFSPFLVNIIHWQEVPVYAPFPPSAR